MKKSLLKFVPIAAIGMLSFASCQKQSQSVSSTGTSGHNATTIIASIPAFETYSNSDLRTQFADVGTLHSQGLDYVYSKLDSIYDNNGIIDTSDFVPMFKTYTNGFAQANLTNISTDLHTMTANVVPDFFDTYLHSNSDLSLTYIQNKLNTTFSTAFTSTFNSILSILDNNSLSVNDKITQWSALISDNSLNALANNTERAAIICGVNVAIADAQYWGNTANNNKWDNLPPTQTNKVMGARLSQDAKNDIVGAVGGAAETLLEFGGTAAAFGPGAVTAVAVLGAVKGAITGTAGAIIIDKVWDWLGL